MKPGDTAWIVLQYRPDQIGLQPVTVGLIHPDGVLEVPHGGGPAGSNRFWPPGSYHATRELAAQAGAEQVAQAIQQHIDQHLQQLERLNRLRFQYLQAANRQDQPDCLCLLAQEFAQRWNNRWGTCSPWRFRPVGSMVTIEKCSSSIAFLYLDGSGGELRLPDATLLCAVPLADPQLLDSVEQTLSELITNHDRRNYETGSRADTGAHRRDAQQVLDHPDRPQ